MDHLIERRVTNRDPREVLSPEVVALLKLCGALRESDEALNEEVACAEAAVDRRYCERRALSPRRLA